MSSRERPMSSRESWGEREAERDKREGYRDSRYRESERARGIER